MQTRIFVKIIKKHKIIARYSDLEGSDIIRSVTLKISWAKGQVVQFLEIQFSK